MSISIDLHSRLGKNAHKSFNNLFLFIVAVLDSRNKNGFKFFLVLTLHTF